MLYKTNIILGYPPTYPYPPPFAYSQDWRQPPAPYPYPPAYLTAVPHPQYAHFPYMPPVAPHQYITPYHQLPPKKPEDNKNDPHATTINQVVQQVTQELKNILKKDFNRKIVEMTAFNKFETW